MTYTAQAQTSMTSHLLTSCFGGPAVFKWNTKINPLRGTIHPLVTLVYLIFLICCLILVPPSDSPIAIGATKNSECVQGSTLGLTLPWEVAGCGFPMGKMRKMERYAYKT